MTQRKTPTKTPTKAANSDVEAEVATDTGVGSELEGELNTQTSLLSAAELVIKRERKRKRRAQARARRREGERKKEESAAIVRMRESIEVIKYCIVGISTVMVTGIVLAIWTLFAVHNEVVKVQEEVEKVRPTVEKIVTQANGIASDVERVRDALKNPLESAGKMIGSELDAKLESLINRSTE